MAAALAVAALRGYPKMQAVRKTVYSLPAVQGYYASLEKVNDYQKFLMDVSKC